MNVKEWRQRVREASLVGLLGASMLVGSIPFINANTHASYVIREARSQTYNPKETVHVPLHSYYYRLWKVEGQLWLELYRRDLYRVVPKNPESPFAQERERETKLASKRW